MSGRIKYDPLNTGAFRRARAGRSPAPDYADRWSTVRAPSAGVCEECGRKYLAGTYVKARAGVRPLHPSCYRSRTELPAPAEIPPLAERRARRRALLEGED